jgi:hypothetical protein
MHGLDSGEPCKPDDLTFIAFRLARTPRSDPKPATVP